MDFHPSEGKDVRQTKQTVFIGNGHRPKYRRSCLNKRKHFFYFEVD